MLQLYESEGIDWTKVAFVDNQDCVDVIEQAPPKCVRARLRACVCLHCAGWNRQTRMHARTHTFFGERGVVCLCVACVVRLVCALKWS